MEPEARQLLEMAGAKSVHNPSYAQTCVKKYGKLLEGIKNPYVKRCTAVLMENEMGYLRDLKEDTLSTDAGSWTKYTFPLLRRVWPNLISNELVSVQPMTSPVSGIFYYEKKYDDRKGSKIPQGSITNLPYNQSYDGELRADDNMQQNFAKYYSSEFNDYDVLCTDTDGAATKNQGAANCRRPGWSPIRAPGVSGQRTFYVKLFYRVLDNAGLVYLDGEATLDPTLATINLLDNFTGAVVGTFDVTTGNWTLNAVDETGVASTFEDDTVIYSQYFVNWELVGYTDGAELPSVSLDITLHEVRAEASKLKARWSVEAVDDLKALHGMDAETELVSTFANDVMLEVDRRIITDLVNGASHADTYTYNGGIPGEMESIRQLITTVGAMAARIHKTTLRAPANFMVVPPGIGSLLDQLSTHGDYASIEQDVKPTSFGPIMGDFGIARVGTLLRKYAVYQDPYMDDDKILIGLRGNNFLDAGYVYAPYVPLQVTPTFLNPDDQTFRKGVRTRYATRMLRPEYYGVITCSNIPAPTTTL